VLVTRQVLEHIVDLNDFIQSINFVLNDDGILVIEIPDSDINLEYLEYLLWKEHVNYFTIHTLKQLHAKHNFSVINHETTLFRGKALFAITLNITNESYNNMALGFEMMKARLYQAHWASFQIQLKQFLMHIMM